MTEKQIALLERLGFSKETDTHYSKGQIRFYETPEGLFTVNVRNTTIVGRQCFDDAVSVCISYIGMSHFRIYMEGEKYDVKKSCKDAEIRYSIEIERVVEFEADEELCRLLDGYENKSVPLGIVQDKLRNLT